MPFRITREMRMMYEAERAFSPKVRLTQWREFLERMGWQRLQQIQRMRRALHTCRSWASESNPEHPFRHSSPNYLYVLARETKDGDDYQSYKLFLNSLGLEATGDTLDAAAERLRITFAPQGNNRHPWWDDTSSEARDWLRKQITQEPRTGGFIELNPARVEPKDQHADKRKTLDPDLHEFMLREALYAALPQRQAEIVLLYMEFFNEDRPQETTGAIAEHLRISPATVRWHKAEALKNHALRKLLRLP